MKQCSCAVFQDTWKANSRSAVVNLCPKGFVAIKWKNTKEHLHERNLTKLNERKKYRFFFSSPEKIQEIKCTLGTICNAWLVEKRSLSVTMQHGDESHLNNFTHHVSRLAECRGAIYQPAFFWIQTAVTRFFETFPVNLVSDWKVKLTALGLTDGHTSITVSIDYSAEANAAAKWRLAGGGARQSVPV